MIQVLMMALLLVLAGCGGTPRPAASTASPPAAAPPAAGAAASSTPPGTGLLAAFGGRADVPALQAELTRVVQVLAQASPVPVATPEVVILASGRVEAMALPGNTVAVTLGLLDLVNSEAELAGVLGRQIAHLAAHHAPRPVSPATNMGGSRSGLAAIGRIAGYPGMAEAVAGALSAVPPAWLPAQEEEADGLALQMVARGGWVPAALARVLDNLHRQAMAEGGAGGDHHQRLDRAVSGIPAGRGREAPEDYLRALDGSPAGDDPAKGLVRGRWFIQPALGFAVEFPDGFTLANTDVAMISYHPSGAALVLDGVRASGDMVELLRHRWGHGLELAGVQPVTVGGLPAATAVGRAEGPVDLRLVAIDVGGGLVYRFMAATPTELTAQFDQALRAAIRSFHRLSPAEVAAVKPTRIQVVAVKPGDTVEGLAAAMPGGDRKVERFLILNGLQPGERLAAGRLVKLLAER